MRSIFFFLLFSLPVLAIGDEPVSPSTRGLKICVNSDAPPIVKDAANRVLAAVGTQPLLGVLAGSTPPTTLTDSAAIMSGPVAARAYNHLVAIGLPTDPVIQAAWQREALVSENGIYIFGFGNLQGDIGYIESGRNPFLHSSAIKSTPFEAETVLLTGTTPEGVKQAVSAFLSKGLINGVVAAPGWTRPTPTLLDRDPLAPDFNPPSVPLRVGNAVCVGVTSANESVYRGALENSRAKPLQIWQFKYYIPGAWDGAGALWSVSEYLTGLHRMSYDNALWVGRYASPEEAASAAQAIGTNSHWKEQNREWTGIPTQLPPNSKEGPDPRTVRLWSNGDSVYISTLPGLDKS